MLGEERKEERGEGRSCLVVGMLGLVVDFKGDGWDCRVGDGVCEGVASHARTKELGEGGGPVGDVPGEGKGGEGGDEKGEEKRLHDEGY